MKTTVVLIRLKIEHSDEADPFEVVDSVLDEGVLQDAINDHESDEGKCTVVSATCGEEIV